MSEAKFGSWTVAESPISIEYSLVVIEEIRHEVAEGFQRLSRGGIEVGGVLYGTRDGRTVRVLAMRPIACEHARGPAFLLSDKDRIALNDQLTRDAEDPHLEGLISVGWFLSHTRSEIALTESDLEIYTIFFPAPWQVSLVIRPGRGGSMRAGYFVREADGTVKSESSYLEFNFPDRLAGVLDRPPDGPRRDRTRKIPSFYRADNAAPPDTVEASNTAVAPMRRDVPTFGQPAQTFSGPQLMPAPTPKKKWPWLIAWAALVLLLAGGAWRFWWQSPAPEPLGLAVFESDGQLRVKWNQAAKKVLTARRGTLEISDGGDPHTITLSREMLASGNFTYVRKSGDVEVKMTVESPDSARWQEASRYLGRPPAAAATSAASIPDPGSPSSNSGFAAGSEEVQAENRRLRSENARLQEQVQKLDRQVKLMQMRGVEPPKEPQ